MSENRYYVWTFRKLNACYDCGQLDKIEVEPNASAVELTEQEFKAFQHGVRIQNSPEYVYFYRQVGDNALTSNITELVKLGENFLQEQVQREEKNKQQLIAREARAAKEAVKKAEKDAKEKRRLYEQLKTEFENER